MDKVAAAGRRKGRIVQRGAAAGWLLAACMALAGTAAAAGAPDPAAPVAAPGTSCPQRDGDTSRPRVGLALGGGGARGVAHLGVLRKLEELGVPVDCIAGTSMGSLVGGLYAAGVPLEEMEQLVLEADWKQLFDDSIPRRERSYRRKQDDREGLATLGLGVGARGVRLAPGVLQGERILSLFQRKTLHVAAVRDFNRLPIPFRAVATDLNTGQPVELGAGSLAQAMRASMSLPGIFQPVRIDGRVLIDGGIAEQVPIDTVRRMGADVVVAVDVGTPLMELDSDASVLQVVSQLTGMLTVGNTRDSTSRLREGDVLVVPGLGEDVATGDFAKAAEALHIGREAAEAAAAQLAALPRWQAAPPAVPEAEAPARIDYVRLENGSRYDDQVLAAILDIPTGQALDADHLERATLRAYNEGTFASVTYEVERNADGLTGVVVRAREKPQGPNYLQAGFRTVTDFSGTNETSLRLAVLRSPATAYGAEARALVGVGSDPELQGEYYHPFDPQARWYLYGRAGARRTTVPVFERGNRLASYEAKVASALLSLGRTFGRYGAAEVGVERSVGEAQVEVGDPALPDVDVDAGSWYAQLAVDRLDSLYFPREGHWSRLTYRRSAGWLGGDARFQEAGLDVLAAMPFGRHAVQGSLAYHATLSGELPLHLRHRLGGRGRLAGFHYNELAGEHYAVLMAGYSYQLASFFRRSAVAGATLEYGNAWERRGDMRLGDGIWNGSLYLGFDSAMGPMLFGYGRREGGEAVLFLEIGKPF